MQNNHAFKWKYCHPDCLLCKSTDMIINDDKKGLRKLFDIGKAKVDE